ncbi:hypothetical protein BATDEDRAFT_89919 [Batrachochytrium dendrobatidis JAM81]|uniref:Phosphoglycerate mutase n=1 Tax=Batrachochytrium dendrobatidis (strain JAM81 / FGSC 10211) TaxID=684364 RepID=F4P608_BATDJ|nr:uncharacterized protein BATDEDRAFT_89919 [Batrachochytrium dendrobatidis JAM81]EGF79275.1 hypothetical protein BATDEDRAFT_89919 [Batrachochytrium dendrobatidis JAM81]|eukprot:XP_006680084.1 hypothetical protein BATDEDRAFT_89919 [Batrachochytrium dendrobatidis JAM81]
MPNTNVLLIRHAEKLTWHKGTTPEIDQKAAYIDNHCLSAKGYERAHALVSYFTNRHEIVSLYEQRPLAAVISQGVDDGPDAWGRSRRPLETVEPLVKAWNLAWPSVAMSAVDNASCTTQTLTPQRLPLIQVLKKDFANLTASIKNGEFEGKTVIISWSHQQLPQLATALGVPVDLVPNKWKGSRFDVTWVVGMEEGKPSTFYQMPQRLLYGDEDTVLK